MADNVPAPAPLGRDRDLARAVDAGRAALALGGSVRVGLEDNFYLPDGEMARSNGDLVAQARADDEDAAGGRRRRRGARAARLARGPPYEPAASTGFGSLDLSRLLPGGFCSLLLADFGADVVKVEDTGMGDYVRWSPPYYEGADDSAKSALFLALNRNKRSIRIDLKTAEGREVLLRPGQGRRRAARVLPARRARPPRRGYDVLRETNPGLVICAITGYGQDGPLRDRSGHDMNYLGLIGLLGLTGEPDGRRCRRPGQIADLGGGALMAAFGILAALRERDRSGEASSSTSR
jgi:hypothetical protein